MKKKYHFIALILLFVSVEGFAQNVRYGVKAGTNVSDWYGDVKESYNNLVDLTTLATAGASIGFHIGPTVQVEINDHLSLESGLIYSQKGSSIRGNLAQNGVLSVLNPQIKVENQSHYLEMPLLAKYFISEGFHIYGGPHMAYLMENELRTQATVLGFGVNQDLPLNNGFRKVDVGLTAGLGYQFENGFDLSLGYDHGLSRLDQNGNFKAFNQNLKASVGFKF